MTNWCSPYFAFQVPDNEDVKTLKQLLQAETGCPPCQQELRGFMSSGSQLYYVNDSRRLSELNLPKENVLQLTTTRDFLAVSSNEEPRYFSSSSR